MVQTAAVSSERSFEKKRVILEAASRVFRRRGLHATGMREIARELGMHVGNLYYYFENKQALLAFCQEDALDGLLDLVASTRRERLAPEEALRRLVVGHVVLLNERTPGSLAHLEIEALGPPWRAAIQRRRDAYQQAYRDLIRQGIADGRLRSIDPDAAAMAILGALNWTVKWFRPEGARSAESIGREFAEILVGGLEIPDRDSREAA
jgi:AcrR family transcriptional regulator